jgi:hypothetical protein
MVQAILFDPERRAADPALKAAIAELIATLQEFEAASKLRQRGRKREDDQKFKLAVEAIGCNLLAARLVDRPLAVPKSSGAMWSGKRYAAPVYGQHFLDALTLMAHTDLGFITNITKGYKFAGERGRQSTIKATIKMLSAMPQVSGWEAFSREAAREVLILRSPKVGGTSDDIDYVETAKTRKLRKEMVGINRWLGSAPIFLAPGCPLLDGNGQPIDPSRRSLRRVFNNGKWTEGGRLFDGFWETMPKAHRKEFLKIGTAGNPQGEPVTSVDYDQLFPRLAYTIAGRKAPEGDLYAVLDGRAERPGLKLLLNAMLFADGPLKHWPEGASRYFTGVSLRDAQAAITEKHEAIAHHFGTGIGYRLMYEESVILVDVLKALRRLDIVALPLHDAVLVAQSNREVAKEVMAERLLQVLPEETRAMVSLD